MGWIQTSRFGGTGCAKFRPDNSHSQGATEAQIGYLGLGCELDFQSDWHNTSEKELEAQMQKQLENQHHLAQTAQDLESQLQQEEKQKLLCYGLSVS